MATPAALTLIGATQVLPAGTNVKVEPTGYWSFGVRSVVAPTVPPVWLAVSFTASMMVTGSVSVLFAALLSLAEPVVPVTVTEIGTVFVPPAVPGVV